MYLVGLHEETMTTVSSNMKEYLKKNIFLFNPFFFKPCGKMCKTNISIIISVTLVHHSYESKKS